jgi:hypothetical protein
MSLSENAFKPKAMALSKNELKQKKILRWVKNELKHECL